MSDPLPESPGPFFSNAAAREYGLADEVWQRAHDLYEEAVRCDPRTWDVSLEAARTVRVPFRKGHVDVLVRCQMKPAEHWILRFTAFSVGEGGELREISREYRHGEHPPVLGEAALLDVSSPW